MSVTEAPQVAVEPDLDEVKPNRRQVWLIPDLFVGLVYAMAGVFMTSRLWLNVDNRMVSQAGDQMFFMWVLRHGARVLTKGANPFFADQLNVPDGANLMANTSALALTIPMSPVTLLFGPRVSFVMLLVIGLAGTAFAWYKVFRRLVGTWQAAAVGGAFCGFGPGIVSHANGHVNWTAQFVVPFIVLAVLRLAQPGKAVSGGIVLGLLAALQAFINEEVLLYTAMGCTVFLVAYGFFAWRGGTLDVRESALRIVRGLGVAAVVIGVLLAYPLYFQFFGPQSYQGVPGDAGQIRADLASYWSFSRLSLAGGGGDNPLALNITEENTFFGWPLLLLIAGGLAWMWNRVLVRAIAATSIAFVLFSLGPTLLASQRNLGIPLPWALLHKVPPLDSVLPTRFGMVLIPLFGVTLALLLDRIRALGSDVRRFAYVAVAAALLPILPTPLPANQFPVTPAFITSGAWKDYVPQGHSLVPVPDTSPGNPIVMTWLADSDADFNIPGGYFIGPATNGRGYYGAYPVRPTTTLLNEVASTGKAPVVTESMRQDLRADLKHWSASALVMPQEQSHAAELRAFVDLLTGKTGETVQDVTVWRVGDLAG